MRLKLMYSASVSCGVALTDAVTGGGDHTQAANGDLDTNYRLLKRCRLRLRRTALLHAPRHLDSADVLLAMQHAASVHSGSVSVWRQTSVPGRVGASARHQMSPSFDASASMRRGASESSPSVAGDPCNVYEAARAICGAGGGEAAGVDTGSVCAAASIHFIDRYAAVAPRRARTGRNRSAGVAASADASRPARSASRPRRRSASNPPAPVPPRRPFRGPPFAELSHEMRCSRAISETSGGVLPRSPARPGRRPAHRRPCTPVHARGRGARRLSRTGRITGASRRCSSSSARLVTALSTWRTARPRRRPVLHPQTRARAGRSIPPRVPLACLRPALAPSP